MVERGDIMKFKLHPSEFFLGLFFMVIALIVIIVSFGYIILYPYGDDTGALVTLIIFVLVLFYPILSNIKDYYSFIIISENGIDVTLLGRSWFQANWSEINYIGTFTKHMGRGVYEFIYFSKVPVIVDKKIIKWGSPSSIAMNYMTVFMQYDRPEVLDEILKYVCEDSIVQHGEYRRKGATFNPEVPVKVRLRSAEPTLL